MTVLAWIFLILVFVVLGVTHAEQEEKRKRWQAAEKTKNDLIRHATPEILAFGLPDPQRGVTEPHPAEANTEPDDPLIDLELGKWSVYNAGILLGAVLTTPGSVRMNCGGNGRVSLEAPDGKLVEYEPYTLSDFHITRHNAGTAILNYTVKSGYTTLQATAVWIQEKGNWRTSTYSVARQY